MKMRVLLLSMLLTVFLTPGMPRAQTAADADFNGNGTVDLADFILFAQAYNTTQARYDLTGDGTVNLSDFLAFARVYGQKVGQEEIQSQVSLPTGSTLKVEDLKIVTPVTSISPDASGSGRTPTTTVSKPQVLLVENARGNPVLLSYVMPAGAVAGKPASGILSKLAVGNTVEVNTTTTAISLVMMNPLLAGSSSEQRAQIVQKVTEHADFSGLVSQIESRLKSNPDEVLNGTGTETMYETATGILVDVLDAGAPAGKDVRTDDSDDPWLADGSGNYLVFVNPNYIYYGTGISSLGGSSYLATKLLMTRSAFFEWRWPPIKFYDESLDSLEVADGDYTILMTKGEAYPFSRITDLSDPVG
ncbi:MAG: hypothetical protein O2954_10460 [bacterium]|nr:hypothetical protein [bacterium]